MNIIKIKKENNYTILMNELIRDKRLSLKSLGLMTYLLSFSSKYQISIRKLASERKESKNTINRLILELRELGYITYERKKDSLNNTIHEYTVNEKSVCTPCLKNEDTPCPKNEDKVNTIDINTNYYDILSFYQYNIINSANIVDEKTLFNYFALLDSKNFDRYVSLYIYYLNEIDHNAIKLFKYVFHCLEINQFKDSKNQNIKNMYFYVEMSLSENVQKLDYLLKYDDLYDEDL